MILSLFHHASHKSAICRLETIMVTMGREGVLVFDGRDFKHLPAQEVDKADIRSVVGAGDCFLAGYLTGIYLDYSMTKAIELGQKCARLTLRSERNVSEQISPSVITSV